MTSSHLNFDQISDLVDGDLPDELKHEYLSHIDSCSECQSEYESLKKCISLVLNVKKECVEIPDICKSTLNLYSKKCQKRRLIKRLPAIAASCLIVVGVGMTVSQSWFDERGAIVASESKQLSKTEKIISFIRESDGTILKMSDKYIDSQIKTADLSKVRTELAKNNLRLEIFQKPFYQISNIQGKNYSDVSVGGANRKKMTVEKISPHEQGKVIIRVFK